MDTHVNIILHLVNISHLVTISTCMLAILLMVTVAKSVLYGYPTNITDDRPLVKVDMLFVKLHIVTENLAAIRTQKT